MAETGWSNEAWAIIGLAASKVRTDQFFSGPWSAQSSARDRAIEAAERRGFDDSGSNFAFPLTWKDWPKEEAISAEPAEVPQSAKEVPLLPFEVAYRPMVIRPSFFRYSPQRIVQRQQRAKRRKPRINFAALKLVYQMQHGR